jgi:hypothetical protein
MCGNGGHTKKAKTEERNTMKNTKKKIYIDFSWISLNSFYRLLPFWTTTHVQGHHRFGNQIWGNVMCIPYYGQEEACY